MLTATTILIISYIIIFSNKINRAIIAILGSCAMIFFGILTQTKAIEGIDFNTITLLIGMMIIVGITQKSGVFQFIAIWTAQKVNANPRGLLISISLVTAIQIGRAHV